MTEIRDPLYEAALISRHELAVVSDERQLLYYELDEFATAAAHNLLQAGCKEGDRIALVLEPGWQYIVLLLAILRIGAVACPMNTRLPAKALREQLAMISCRRLIAPEKFALNELGDIKRHAPGALIEVIIGSIPRGEVDKPMVLERPATIVFTSGSTGRAKAVLHTFGNHYYNARGSNINIKVSSRDRWLLTLPLYHVGGLGILFRCILSGAVVAIPHPGETISEAQERLEATHVSLVSTQLYRMLKADPIPPSFLNLKAMLLGGGPVRAELLKESWRRRLPVFMSYGLSEMASQVTTVRPTSPPEKRLTSGQPLKYRQMKIAADGEILVKGAVLFAGYVEGGELVRPLDADGWFATGDLGVMDAEGYLTVTGRKDNMFVSGGENIQPEEIERALCALDDIDDACVVPVPDEEFGFRPAAFIKGRDGGPDLGSLEARLASVLPRFKLPVAYHRWPGHLKAEGIKINRSALCDLARAGHHG